MQRNVSPFNTVSFITVIKKLDAEGRINLLTGFFSLVTLATVLEFLSTEFQARREKKSDRRILSVGHPDHSCGVFQHLKELSNVGFVNGQ